jgi:hypothetical protein
MKIPILTKVSREHHLFMIATFHKKADVKICIYSNHNVNKNVWLVFHFHGEEKVCRTNKKLNMRSSRTLSF